MKWPGHLLQGVVWLRFIDHGDLCPLIYSRDAVSKTLVLKKHLFMPEACPKYPD